MDFTDELRAFAGQLRAAAEAFQPISLPKMPKKIIYGGMGGSGIAADFVQGALYDKAPMPITVVKDYHLPAWGDEDTLVVLASYSGNTEETLSLFDEATARNAMTVAVTTGGQLGERAQAQGIPLYRMPAGYQPRMAFGYSLGYQLLITGSALKPLVEWTPQWLQTLADRFEPTEPFETLGEGWSLRFCPECRFVIFTDRPAYPVALRLMQQLNENAKMEACVHPVPEFNHNGLEGWRPWPDVNYVFLFTEGAPRIARRFAFMRSMIEAVGAPLLEKVMPNHLEGRLEVTYALDFLSLAMAERRGVDAQSVPTISRLKAFLAQE